MITRQKIINGFEVWLKLSSMYEFVSEYIIAGCRSPQVKMLRWPAIHSVFTESGDETEGGLSPCRMRTKPYIGQLNNMPLKSATVQTARIYIGKQWQFATLQMPYRVWQFLVAFLLVQTYLEYQVYLPD